MPRCKYLNTDILGPSLGIWSLCHVFGICPVTDTKEQKKQFGLELVYRVLIQREVYHTVSFCVQWWSLTLNSLFMSVCQRVVNCPNLIVVIHICISLLILFWFRNPDNRETAMWSPTLNSLFINVCANEGLAGSSSLMHAKYRGKHQCKANIETLF